MNQKNFLFVATVALFLLSGCGTVHNIHKVEVLGKGYKWEHKDDAKRIATKGIAFTKPNLYNDVFSLQVNRTFDVREIEYERYVDLYQRNKDADLSMIVNPIGLAVCSIDQKGHCFGSNGKWRRSKERSRNEKFTDKVKSVTELFEEYGLYGTAIVTGYSKEGPFELKPVEVAVKDGVFRFNLKKVLESMPEKPISARVNAQLNYENYALNNNYNLREELVDKLNLYQVRWLPVKQRKEIYLKAIRDNLKSGNQRAVLANYDKLWRLKLTMPESFYYHYAVSANALGKIKRAHEMAAYYLKVNKKGKYVDKAQEILQRKI